MTLIRGLACAVCLAASALAGTAGPPNVILITLDTTRADRMGFLGSTRGLTPNLDGLARQSVVFTHAYSQAPLTPVSHASILTGTYPQFHQVIDFNYPLAKDLPYAPEILRAHGYRTAAFIAAVVLDPAGGAPGFDRGFDTYDAPFGYYHSRLPSGASTRFERLPGEDVVTHALGWLSQNPRGPFFVWVHLYDAHDPYQSPEPFKTRYAAEPYDGGVAHVDAVVGELLRQLKARGLYEGTVIAVTADHGESLGAHGEETHGIFLYDETIQVPLVIKLPHNGEAGRRIESRVELVDVLPTILQAVGVEIPKEMQGASLLELMKTGEGVGEAAASWRDRPAYAQADYPHIAYGWSALQSLRTGKYLYVQAPHRELYDEVADPQAQHNLAAESTAVADTVGDRLESFRQKTMSKGGAPKMLDDPAARERLAELGYVMNADVSAANAIGPGSDPKDPDNIQTAAGLRHADALIRSRNLTEAIPLLQQLIARNPFISNLYFKLGDCYLKLKQYDKAVPLLRQAVEMAPTSSRPRWELGMALVEIKDFAAAAPELEQLLPKAQTIRNPDVPALFFKLGQCYLKLKQYDKAVPLLRQAVEMDPTSTTAVLDLGTALLEVQDFVAAVPELATAAALLCGQTSKSPPAECERSEEPYQALETNPDAYAANLLLGRALLLAGDVAAAVPKLGKAAELQPNTPEPHTLLADAYVQLGHLDEAASERAEAKRLGARDED
jgi:arylsulfatase A-like enzyme/tetratricopeptide (TPR) repeat protein